MTSARVPTASACRRKSWLSTHRSRLIILGAMLLVVGLIVGFIVTAIGADVTGELQVDVEISRHRDAVLTALAQFVDVALGPSVAPALLLVVFGLLWLRSRYAAVTVVGLTIVGWFSVEVAKAVVGRPRPPAVAVQALVTETAADSYPSGHTAFAAAAVFAVGAAVMIAGRRASRVWAIGVPVVVVVAASRLYLGVHYLSDVAASVAFAGGSILIAVGVTAPLMLRLHHIQERKRLKWVG